MKIWYTILLGMVSAEDVRLAEHLGGVNAVLAAPFRDVTADVDSARASELARGCDEAGIHAITALGNTGELYQLAERERRILLRAIAESTSRAIRIAGVGGSFADALRLAETAAELGYEAVMPHEPLDPLASDEGIATFLADLADRCPLPCVLYVRTGRLSRKSIVELACHPRVVGIKYARPEMSLLGELLADEEVRSACVWACGSAESMVPVMRAHGLVGFTSGLANVRPDLALGVWEASRAGDIDLLAERVRRVLPFELLRTRDGGRHNVAVIKEALHWYGFDVGKVRPPCVSLDGPAASELEKVLRSWPAPSP